MHGAGHSSRTRARAGALSVALGLVAAIAPVAAHAEGLVMPRSEAPIVPHAPASSPAVGTAPASAAPAAPDLSRADSAPARADDGTHIAPPEPNYEPPPPPSDLPELQDPSCLLACVEKWEDYYTKLWFGQNWANEHSDFTTVSDHVAETQYKETAYSLTARIIRLKEPTASDDVPITWLSGVIVDTFPGGGPPISDPRRPEGSQGYSAIGLLGGLFDRLFPDANFQTINRSVEDGGGSGGAF